MLNMLRKYSLRSLYPLALAEGEGAGTAYEYVAKRLVLRRWLRERPSGRLLVAGLPEVYGASLDYLLLAEELEMPAVVADDRPDFLEAAEQALKRAQQAGLLSGVQVEFVHEPELSEMSTVQGNFGWCICNEVLQRFDRVGQIRYVTRLGMLAPVVTLFAPNQENKAHVDVSGLSGVQLFQMKQLVSVAGGRAQQLGFCDMPPFPPGVSRSEAQRTRAGAGKAEAAAMWGLGLYVRLEPFVPERSLRRSAHIVYGLFRTEHV